MRAVVLVCGMSLVISWDCNANDVFIDIAKSPQGTWIVYKDDLPDGFQALDFCECVQWVKRRYDVPESKINVSRSPDDSNRLLGLCGVNFGERGEGVLVETGYDKGLLTNAFVPKNVFDEFTTGYTLSTPKTHKICKIVLLIDKSIAFADKQEVENALKARIPGLKKVLSKRYAGAVCDRYGSSPNSIRFDFIGAVLTMYYADESSLKDMWGNLFWMHRNVVILAKDHALYAQGKQEAKELESERLAASVNAL